MYGYFAGPVPHIIDDLALGDALLARLPAKPSNWGPGHFRRDIPTGYIETIRTGVNQITDPGVHEYYDDLRLVISGDLWNPERLKNIVLFNLGCYDHLLIAYSKAVAAQR